MFDYALVLDLNRVLALSAQLLFSRRLPIIVEVCTLAFNSDIRHTVMTTTMTHSDIRHTVMTTTMTLMFDVAE